MSNGLMRRPAGGVGTAACLALGLVAGCGEPEARPRAVLPVPSPPFSALFELQGRIALAEPDSALITRVAALDVDGNGRLLVPEPALGEVRVYDRTGRLLGRLGRRGDGPGELRRPLAAAFGRDGRIYVSDAGTPRITRFTASLTFDTVFPLPGAYFGGDLAAVEEAIAVFVMREGQGARLYDLYSTSGELQASFHTLHPLIHSVPGWLAAARGRLAVGAGYIFVAENLLYPFTRYTLGGGFVDSVGVPPASWRPASRPRRETLEGPGAWARFQHWRRTFTTIAALGVYRDSLLLVAHERLDPDVLAYEAASYRLDLYRVGPELEKIAEDVALPGPLLHAGDAAYLLLGGPPGAESWTLGRYRLRSRADRSLGVVTR